MNRVASRTPVAVSRAAPSRTQRRAEQAAVVLAAAALLLTIDLPGLGSDGWPFATGRIHAQGALGWLVALAGGRWDVDLLRAGVVAALTMLAVAGLLVLRGWRPGRPALTALAMLATAAVLVPPVMLQAGLRQSSAPWFYTNDSTYQIELAGGLVRNGHSPYGHDYHRSGLARFYTLDGRESARAQRFVMLRHFPYFPGSVIAAAAWQGLPAPWNDYRLFVVLATLLLVPAALLFPGHFGCRLALGVALACNPVAVRLAWFGNGDAPCLLGIVAAFGLASRGRYRSAAAALAGAVLFKQFALAAVPALLVLIAMRSCRREAVRAAAVGAAVLAVAFLPFVLASPAAVWSDTVVYGTSSFHVVSYGVAGILARFGLLGRHSTDYPALALMLLVWAPVTAYAALAQWRSKASWTAGAGFTVSVFVLLLIARVFQESYIIYPLSGVLVSMLLALERLEISVRAEQRSPAAPVPIEVAAGARRTLAEPVALPVAGSQAS